MGRSFAVVLAIATLGASSANAQFVLIDQKPLTANAHGIALRGSTWYVAAPFTNPGLVRTYDVDFNALQTIQLDQTIDSRGLTYATTRDTFFVTDAGHDSVFEYRINGGSAILQQEWSTLSGEPNAIGYDAIDETLWLAYRDGTIEHRSFDGGVLGTFGFNRAWTGLSVDPVAGTLVLLDGPDLVWEVGKDGSGLTQLTIFDMTPGNGQGIARDISNGLLYVTDLNGRVTVLQDPQRAGCAQSGVNLLVSQGQPFSGGVETYYGGSQWTEMTALLDGKAESVTVTPDLTNLNFMMSFDVLWIDQRGTDSDPGSFLTPTEENNIEAFIQSGKRVVIFGENNNWSDWNSQILGLVGANYGGGNFSGVTTPAMANSLTATVDSVEVVTGGVAIGGSPVFLNNFASLHDTTVLTVLEVSSQATLSWTKEDNARFFSNMADWAACSQLPIFGDGFETGNTTEWSSTIP